jgi:hypothetical protein
LEYSEKVDRRVKTARFPRGFAKTALEIAHKTAINGLFSRYVRACSARFATFSGIPLVITTKKQRNE